MPQDTTRDRLIEIVVKTLGQPPKHSVDETSRFIEDLGADSLDVIDLIMSVEDAFAVEIPDAWLEQLHTIGDVLALIERLRAAPEAA